MIKTWELKSRAQSGRSIYRMAEHFRDLGPYLDTTLSQFFDLVKNAPYIEDTVDEVTARPKYYLSGILDGMDCKKKMIFMGAWLNAHGIPWRLVAVSENPDKEIHHVLIQANIQNNWKNIDPTFSDFQLFEGKENVTFAKELLR